MGIFTTWRLAVFHLCNFLPSIFSFSNLLCDISWGSTKRRRARSYFSKRQFSSTMLPFCKATKRLSFTWNAAKAGPPRSWGNEAVRHRTAPEGSHIKEKINCFEENNNCPSFIMVLKMHGDSVCHEVGICLKRSAFVFFNIQ